jgi:hypothetical protein
MEDKINNKREQPRRIMEDMINEKLVTFEREIFRKFDAIQNGVPLAGNTNKSSGKYGSSIGVGNRRPAMPSLKPLE